MGCHLGDAGLTKPKVPLIGHISCCLGQSSAVPGTFPSPGLAPALCTHGSLCSLSLFLTLRLMSAYCASGTEKGAREAPQRLQVGRRGWKLHRGLTEGERSVK